MPQSDACAVAIVDDDGLSATDRLAAALDRAGLWNVLRKVQSGRAPGAIRIVIKPELAGFALDSPAATDPVLVEDLIDCLHDRGFTNAAVVGTADSSSLWAENRDLHALSDLLGYHYATRKDRSYDIVDLVLVPTTDVFPIDSVLHGCAISREWLDADMRIVFSKNRTDEAAGYALCLDTLIGVLPLIDKDLHYRKRRHPGDVVAAILGAAPVEFCLIDAVVSAHRAGGRRAPAAIDTRTIIAATDIVLADHVGALKMGLDPGVSPMFERVVRTRAVPRRYIVTGSLLPYSDWENIPALSLQAARTRSRTETLDRLVEPWLQRLDSELFPLRHPLDARLNAALAEFLAAPAGELLRAAADALLAWLGAAIASYRTMFDKDALTRQAVPLGLEVDEIPAVAFDDLVKELLRLEPIAATAPRVSDELRWQYLGDAVMFQYVRPLPIDFDLFVLRVDIARTIQFMNDYLGGVLVALAHDASGRPVRQAERNIYLPQPNYLALCQGKPIDVSKLEVVEYGEGRHRLYWKTMLSENASATYDDGIATFERAEEGTRITIVGKQQFALPPFWQVFDPAIVPDLKAMLVTHAYQTFFDRTIANFEALVEGRDIRIGRPVDEPAPPPAEWIMPLLQGAGEIAMPLLQLLSGKHDSATTHADGSLDADGFVHIAPMKTTSSEPALWTEEIARFIDGLGQAVHRDMTRVRQAA